MKTMFNLSFNLRTKFFLSLTFIVFALFTSCQKDDISPQEISHPDVLAAKKTKMDKPTITCEAGATQASVNIKVCAGATGAPAGFSIQWVPKSILDLNGGWNGLSDPANPYNAFYCGASFSGNANGSNYNLGAGLCVTVNIGENLFDDPGASSSCYGSLICGTEYAFRSFAHANSSLNRSDFTATLVCSTLACTEVPGCTFTQGYWKTHGPEGCLAGNNSNVWPVSSLMLGSVSYSDLELCSIFQTPASGNGLISLSHQLMAAKLNIENGSDGSAITATIAAADALIGGLVVPPVGGGYLAPGTTSVLNAALTAYNEGLTGPGHCQ
jgi:hypothetical protein